MALSASLALACGDDSADDGVADGTTQGLTPSTVGEGPDTTAGEGPTDGGGTSGSGSGASGGSSETGGPAGPACPPGEDATVITFEPELFDDGDDPAATAACDIANPERGFHRFVDLRSIGPGSLDAIAATNDRLVYGRILIPEYREMPLDMALLDELDAAFAVVRDAGLKVVPRFHYSNAIDEEDASLDRILGHIAQIEPLLADNADVIFTMQAGFIGAWGEWHGSMNGLDAPGPRLQILDALLLALPPERTLQVRRPSFKEDAYGGPVDETTAWGLDGLARVGHVNDCFLASDTDFGTYAEPAEKDFAVAESPFVPVGGETCAVNPPRSECAEALAELELLHWSNLNRDYHPDVIASWATDGCLAQVECRLGHRLALTEVQYGSTVAAGQTWGLQLTVHNDGWAAPINARRPVVVLEGPEEFIAPLEVDIRTWASGQDVTQCVALPIPEGLSPGEYEVGLRLPDEAPSLANDPRYSIQLLGPTWDAGTVTHALGATVTVTE